MVPDGEFAVCPTISTGDTPCVRSTDGQGKSGRSVDRGEGSSGLAIVRSTIRRLPRDSPWSKRFSASPRHIIALDCESYG